MFDPLTYPLAQISDRAVPVEEQLRVAVAVVVSEDAVGSHRAGRALRVEGARAGVHAVLGDAHPRVVDKVGQEDLALAAGLIKYETLVLT